MHDLSIAPSAWCGGYDILTYRPSPQKCFIFPELHPLAAAVLNNLTDVVADGFALSYERAQAVSFTHPVGSTVTGIISGSAPPQVVSTHGTFLFDTTFYFLNVAVLASVIALAWFGFHLLQVLSTFRITLLHRTSQILSI